MKFSEIKKRIHLLLSLVLLFANISEAKEFNALGSPVEIVETKVSKFENYLCWLRNSCELEKFSVTVDRYVVHYPNGDENFGTRLNAIYKTDQVSSLPKFGMVQFIKGCQYTSKVVGGLIENFHDIYIPWRNDTTRPYHFQNWTIDGPSLDPLDWCFDSVEGDRHACYKWNTTPGSVDPKSSFYFGEKTPTNPYLFVRDLPGTAFYDSKLKIARNISLKFRTCIYKTEDIPLISSESGSELPLALYCKEWSHSWVYDFNLEKMTSPTEIVDFCR